MRIHTNLTHSDIVDCARGLVSLTTLSEHGSRSRERAFEVKLSGSSPYRQNFGTEQAATWDEWGVFIARIFAKDSDAIAGHYKSADLFHEVTDGRFENGELPADTHARHKWEYNFDGGPHYCAKCSATMNFHTLDHTKMQTREYSFTS